MKGTFIMAKDTDKILHQRDGYKEVSAEAKKGTAKFTHYESVETLLKREKKEKILSNYNRMERVDSINTVNRPDATPSPVRELGKLAKAADTETQAEITAAVQAILDKAAKAVIERAKAGDPGATKIVERAKALK